MKKDVKTYDDFLVNVIPDICGFVRETHDAMLRNSCTFKVTTAKSGLVLSYILPKSKRIIFNYVFRKQGLIIRIYGDNIARYFDFLTTLPENMISAIVSAPMCKRLANPSSCNPRCPLGYVFEISGEGYESCRYSSFMFEVKEENYKAVREFISREMKERAG